jgi:hypothetical protein
MKLSNITPEEAVNMGDNAATLLAGTALTAIDPAVRTDLLTAIGTLPADLGAAESDALIQAAQAKAGFAARDVTMDALVGILRNLRSFLIAGNAPKEQFDLCMFDKPLTTRTMIVAQVPTNLTVLGYSNHVNKGQFEGNNKSGTVVYELWRREGDEGPWGLHMQTRKQSFSDQGVTPGQYYEYKVRAVAAHNTSDFSNTNVVYGM